MLDTLKIDSTGKATIVDLYAFMDGGTVMVKLAAVGDNEIEIRFNQNVDLKVTDRNVNPAALLLNKKLVAVRSDLEKTLLTTIKNSKFADTVSESDKAFKECLDQSIDYIESEQYVATSKALGRI